MMKLSIDEDSYEIKSEGDIESCVSETMELLGEVVRSLASGEKYSEKSIAECLIAGLILDFDVDINKCVKYVKEINDGADK